MKIPLAPLLVGIGAIAVLGCSGGSSPEEPRIDAALTRDLPGVVRFDCRRAAREMSYGAVYCPPLVPEGRTRSQNRSSRGRVSVTASGDTYILHFVTRPLGGFDPAQPHGFRRHLGHWFAAAYDSRRHLTTGPGARVVDEIDVDGVPVTLVERRSLAYSVDAGHVLAIWPFEGRAFELSLHGFEHRGALLGMVRAQIAAMRSCRPASGPPSGSHCRLVFAAHGGQIADCRRGPVIAGSGRADWRRRSIVAGPLGVLRHPLAQMVETRNGQLIAKLPVLVEGSREVRLSVPPRERRRVFLYYGRFRDRAGHPTTLIGRAPGFSEIRFRPCEDRPRTIWPGGIRVRGRRPVRLLVRVEGREKPIPLPLGAPRLRQPRKEEPHPLGRP